MTIKRKGDRDRELKMRSSASQYIRTPWEQTLAFLQLHHILCDLLFGLFFLIVLGLFSTSIMLSMIVGFISFPQISHDQHATCIVLNHTVITDCSNSSDTKQFRRAYLVEIRVHNVSQGQMLDPVEPWYPSETAAISQLQNLLPLGSKRSCIYDPETLLLNDARHSRAQDIIVAWAIIVAVFLICFFFILFCWLQLKRSPAQQSFPLTEIRSEPSCISRDDPSR